MFDFLAPNTGPHLGADGRSPLLPLDVVVSIISYLDSTADLASIARISRIHHYLALPFLYRHVTLKPTQSLPAAPIRSLRYTPFLAALATLQKPMIAGCVKHLTIRGPLHPTPTASEYWAAGLWSDAEGTLALSFAGILNNLTALQSFTWDVPDTFPHPFLYIALSRHPTLTKLSISYPEPLRDHPLESRPPPFVAPPLPRLKELRILDFGTPPWQDNIGQLVTGSSCVTSFTLTFRPETVLSQKEFSAMVQRTKITAGLQPLRVSTVRLAAVVDVVDGFFDFFFDIEKIRTIVLWDCKIASESWRKFFHPNDPVPPESTDSFPSPSSSSPQAATTPLSVRSSTTSNTLKPSPKPATGSTPAACPDEHTIHIQSYTTNILTPQYVTPLFSFSSALTKLFFVDTPANTSSLTPALKAPIVTALTTRFPNLQKLRLSRTWVLTRDDLSRIIRACSGLRELMVPMNSEEWEIMRWLARFLGSLTGVVMLEPMGVESTKGLEELVEKWDAIEADMAIDGFTGIRYIGISGVVLEVESEVRWDGKCQSGMGKDIHVDAEGRTARRRVKQIPREAVVEVLEVVACEDGIDVR